MTFLIPVPLDNIILNTDAKHIKLEVIKPSSFKCFEYSRKTMIITCI